MHRTSRYGHTPRLKYHVHASAQLVATYQVDLPVLNFSSWKVTVLQFPSFNRSFCARRINATRESLLAQRNNATPFFLTYIVSRDKLCSFKVLCTSPCVRAPGETSFFLPGTLQCPDFPCALSDLRWSFVTTFFCSRSRFKRSHSFESEQVSCCSEPCMSSIRLHVVFSSTLACGLEPRCWFQGDERHEVQI